MIEVKFEFPKELDIAFWFLNKQMKKFIEDEVPLPNHEISFSEDEISIILWYPDSEDDEGGGNDGDDPIWPLPPDPVPTFTYSITTYLPEFNE